MRFEERLGIDSLFLNFYINTNAINLITSIGIAPHPIPLPSGERDRVRGPIVKKLNAFVLVLSYFTVKLTIIR
jgi:hypothetical protein